MGLKTSDVLYIKKEALLGVGSEDLSSGTLHATDKEKIRCGIYHKITPVSHTWIGGYLKPWHDMWLEFWDNTTHNIEWVSLDEFMADFMGAPRHLLGAERKTLYEKSFGPFGMAPRLCRGEG